MTLLSDIVGLASTSGTSGSSGDSETTHNDLGGLNVGDYKHLTAAEKTLFDTVEENADVTDAVNIATTIHAAPNKDTLVSADEFGLVDSAAANVLKRITWTKLRYNIQQSGIVLVDGTQPLTSDWDIGDGQSILTDTIAARDSDGLRLYNDGGVGLVIRDDNLIFPTPSSIFPIPLINIMLDSGRFAGDAQSPLDRDVGGAFAASDWFTPYNGSSAWTEAGQFIFNNSTYGGTAGVLTQDVVDLLTAMGRTGNYGRYGIEFYIAESTMGSGTSSAYLTGYLLSTNPAYSMFGNANYCTWTFWIRVETGGPLIMRLGDYIWKDGVFSQNYITITSGDGWTHVVTADKNLYGYNNGFPYIYANENDVVQIALPSVFRGFVWPGIHVNPIGTV